MTHTKDEALKLALEALESCETGHITDGGKQWHDEKLVDKALTVCEQALAAQQEPVAIIEQLWAIIDDIDTYGDMAKNDDKAFRAMVERRQKDRWKTGITTDGYTLNVPTPPAAQPAVPEGWQPIDTAPKDFCTEFDGWNGKRVPDVSWARPEFNQRGDYAWCVQQYENGYGWVNVEVTGLTHWRPIPSAPEKGQP
jgi:hypothetical protein